MSRLNPEVTLLKLPRHHYKITRGSKGRMRSDGARILGRKALPAIKFQQPGIAVKGAEAHPLEFLLPGQPLRLQQIGLGEVNSWVCLPRHKLRSHGPMPVRLVASVVAA